MTVYRPDTLQQFKWDALSRARQHQAKSHSSSDVPAATFSTAQCEQFDKDLCLVWGSKGGQGRAQQGTAPLAAQEQRSGDSGAWAQRLHFFHQLTFDKLMMLRNTTVN